MTEVRADFEDFVWVDISDPTPERLNRLAEEYDLHPTSVQDCLQPEHLPKFETIGDVNFVVLRAYDSDCKSNADSVQELTRKVAIFFSDRFVISIHRVVLPFISELQTRLSNRPDKISLTPEHVMADLLYAVLKTFESPVHNSMEDLELFEMEIFGAGTQRKFKLQKGYYLKRRISVIKRMLRATQDPIAKIMAGAEVDLAPHFQDARDVSERLWFYADEINENIQSLLNLHISLASQKTNEASRRTNEVMRVLTIFSCFFLPINFIASIYGMNFEFIPETKWPYGYFFSLGLMAVVVLGIFVWFRRRGWLKSAPN